MGLPVVVASKEILVDQDGNLAFLMADTLYSYGVVTTNPILASATLPKSDLGEPSVDKLINYIDADYVGSFTLVMADSAGLNHTITFPTSTIRSTQWVNFPLSLRKPFQKIQLTISSSTIGTIINGIEIDFSALQRRRYN